MGPTPVSTELGRDPRQQLSVLHHLLAKDRAELDRVVAQDWKLVLANHGFWSRLAPHELGIASDRSAETLRAIEDAWVGMFPDQSLPSGEAAFVR